MEEHEGIEGAAGAAAPSRAPATHARTGSGQPRLGLALGGGGARGLAHAGVLQALQDAGIAVHAIAGTSIGAIVGGLFAAGADPRREKLRLARLIEAAPRPPLASGPLSNRLRALFDAAAYLERDIFGLGRQDGEALEAGIVGWVGRRRIQDLELPFAAVATDVRSGDAVVIDSGPLAPAIHASAALPGVYQPVPWKGRLLMDGGVVHNLPVAPARRLGVDVVLAVTVTPRLDPEVPRTGLGLLARAQQMGRLQAEARALQSADLALRVPVPREVGLFDFDRSSELISMGRTAMEAALPALQTALQAALQRTARSAAAAMDAND